MRTRREDVKTKPCHKETKACPKYVKFCLVSSHSDKATMSLSCFLLQIWWTLQTEQINLTNEHILRLQRHTYEVRNANCKRIVENPFIRLECSRQLVYRSIDLECGDSIALETIGGRREEVTPELSNSGCITISTCSANVKQPFLLETFNYETKQGKKWPFEHDAWLICAFVQGWYTNLVCQVDALLSLKTATWQT